MPETDTLAELYFPSLGLDLSGSYARQRLGTTPIGVNVRTFDPRLDRARGGSRAGLIAFADQIPEGDELIQHLNVVVLCTTESLLDADPPDDPDPITGLPPIDDPSSPGLPIRWGTGIIVRNPDGSIAINPDTGMPYTSTADRSRNPGGSGGLGTVFPHKRRQGGTGVQPNMNTLTHARGGNAPHYCFQGSIGVRIHAMPPDPFGLDMTEPVFNGVLCAPYAPPAYQIPATALLTKTPFDDVIPLGGPPVPEGTTLLDEVGLYLRLVGPGSTAEVIIDLVSLPSSSQCSSQPCGGAPPPTEMGGGIGVQIERAVL